MKYHFVDHQNTWVNSLKFKDISSRLFLDLVGAARNDNRPDAIVFDLDSTLFSVSRRLRSVYRAWLTQTSSESFLNWRLVDFLSPENHSYRVDQMFELGLQRMGLSRQEAHLHAQNLWKSFYSFWKEGFFSDRFIHQDEPFAGAVALTRECWRRGFELVYLTGRDRPRSAAATFERLRTCGFPMDLRTHIWMKPQREMSDLDYKEQASAVLKSRFNVRAFLDNEPENLIMAARRFPLAEVVFVHTIMSERIPSENYQGLLGHRQPWRLSEFSEF